MLLNHLQQEVYKRSNIDPRAFVILDDCLSSVDTKTEKAILNGLKKLKSGVKINLFIHPNIPQPKSILSSKSISYDFKVEYSLGPK